MSNAHGWSSPQPNQAANLDVDELNCYWPTGVLSIHNLNLLVVSVGALSSQAVFLIQLLSRLFVLMRSGVVLCILFGVCGAVLSNVNGAVLTKRLVDFSDSADVTAGTATPGENVLTETHDAGEKFPMPPSATGRVNVSSEMQTQSTSSAAGETINFTVATSEKPSTPALEHTSPDLGEEAFIGKVDLPNAVSESSTSSEDSEHATNPVTSTTTTTGIPHLMSTLTAFSVEINRESKTERDMGSQEQVAAIEELFRSKHQDTDDVDAINKAHSHHGTVIKPVSADATNAVVSVAYSHGIQLGIARAWNHPSNLPVSHDQNNLVFRARIGRSKNRTSLTLSGHVSQPYCNNFRESANSDYVVFLSTDW
ncbi:hypothetical protein EG68_08667 [Paragonimus skrjabini miyazakii]|uniref:Uncharacterized protein n=1 Tax=Paragonimus skrjabini miyazakii TaxID=59628 RepID=A0A8S9YVA1_9TREM|nr:hypothetical protein EG68_08667 [Paragonimus skrjabini miyazakii]